MRNKVMWIAAFSLLAACGSSNDEDSVGVDTTAVVTETPPVETTVTTPASTAPTMAPDTTPAPPTAAPSTEAPTTDAPTTTVAPTTTGAPTTTAAPTIVHTLDAFDYHDVPALGNPEIRGSGCGSGKDGDPTLGDRLPDGIWFGSFGPYIEEVPYDGPGGNFFGYARIDGVTGEFDLWCVYTGDLGAALFAGCGDRGSDCEYESRPEWYPEDNVNRLRTVPFADDWEYIVQDPRQWFNGVECSNEPWNSPWGGLRSYQVWIAVNGGSITSVLATCDKYVRVD